MAEGQNGEFEDSSPGGLSSELQHTTGKLLGENEAQNISSLPFSKIEVLLSRIAGAQEAIVLAAEKQGPPVRFTDSTKPFDLEQLEQTEGASRARVTRGAHGEDLQQNTREPEDEHQRRILDHRPLDRIARVQERLVELTESPGLSHVDPFSLKEESTGSKDDHAFHTPTEGIESLAISEGSHEPVQRGEDAVQSVTDEQLNKERSRNELRVARQTDDLSFEAEPNDRIINERNGRLVPTSDSNGNDGLHPESETRLKSKGKDKQYALEQLPRRLRPLTASRKTRPRLKRQMMRGLKWRMGSRLPLALWFSMLIAQPGYAGSQTALAQHLTSINSVCVCSIHYHYPHPRSPIKVQLFLPLAPPNCSHRCRHQKTP